jgi:hypothetical protein
LPPARDAKRAMASQAKACWKSPAAVVGRLQDIEDARLLGRPKNNTELAGSEGTAVQL